MAEPVTLAEAKAQTRMENDDSQDTFLTSLIAPARAYVERVSTYSFVAGDRDFTFSRWGDFLEIYLRPVTAVAISYVDEDGEDADYDGALVSLGRFPLRIHPGVGDDFPAIADGGSITVTVTAGAVSSTSQEYLIGKRAMLLLIGHWFENRETVVIGQASAEVDFAVRSLLDDLRPISAY